MQRQRKRLTRPVSKLIVHNEYVLGYEGTAKSKTSSPKTTGVRQSPSISTWNHLFIWGIKGWGRRIKGFTLLFITRIARLLENENAYII